MGYEGQLIPRQFTPRASVSTWSFYKIDWPIQFCPPRRGAKDFAHLVVYLHERAWWDKGVHRIVSKADIAVLRIPDIQVPNGGNRYLAPNFHHAGEESRLLYLKPFVEADGKSGEPVFIVNFHPCRMRFRQT